MPDQIPSILAGLAANLSEAFLLPGELVLSGVRAVAPRTAEVLAFGTGGIVTRFVLALATWTALVVVGLLLSRACRRLAQQFVCRFHVLIWRTKMYLGNLKTRLIWKYREYFPYKSTSSEQLAQTDFDSMDIAILLTIARRGPAIASSAPDICNTLDLRPAQVQSRLEQLKHFKMVCSVIGSTDGFDNYSLSNSGQAYLEMMQRQAQKAPAVSQASPAKSY